MLADFEVEEAVLDDKFVKEEDIVLCCYRIELYFSCGVVHGLRSFIWGYLHCVAKHCIFNSISRSLVSFAFLVHSFNL